MAATKTSVEIWLGMNTRKFEKAIKRGLSLAKKFAKKLQARQGALRNASLGLGAAFAGQLFLMNKMTKAAGAQELAETKLENALKNVKTAREGDAEMLMKQATALQEVTAYGDEEIINAQAMLATFQMNAEQISQVTVRLLDMASGMQKLSGESMDLMQLSALMGKAFSGQTSALSRYGVILGEDTIKTKDFNLILRDLDSNFAGMAEGSLDTFMGKKKQLANYVGDLNEAIGRALIPTLHDLMAKILPVVKRMTEWVDRNRTVLAIIMGVGVGGTGLLAALSLLGFALTMIIPLFAMPAIPILIGLLVALAAAALVVSSRMNEKVRSLQDVQTELATTEGALETAKIKVEQLSKAEEDLKEVMGKESEELIEQRKRVEELTEKVTALIEEKRVLADLEAGLPTTVAEANTALRENAEELTAVQEAVEKSTAALKEHHRATVLGTWGTEVNSAEQKRLEKQLKELEEREQTLINREQELIGVRVELVAAQKGNIAGNEDEKKSVEELRKEFEAFYKKLKEGVALRKAEEKRKKLFQEVTPRPGLGPDPGFAGGTVENVKGVGEIEIPFAKVADGADEAKMSVQDLRDALLEIPEEVNPALAEMVEANKELFADFGAYGANVFLNMFDTIYAHEKNILKATAKAAYGMLLSVLKAYIGEKTVELLATQAAEVGKALIEAPMTLGASLAKIPLILAAAGAAMAGIAGLESKFSAGKKFHEGGVSAGGPADLLPGEIVLNPKKNTLADLGRWLGAAGGLKPGGALSGVGSDGRIEVNIGTVSSQVDIDDLLSQISTRIKMATWRR